MRVLIAGSRDYPRLDQVRKYVAEMPEDWTVIHGGARGVDRTAGDAAEARGLGIEEHPADWETYGRTAGFVRNAAMVGRADLVVVFWDGKSRGSWNTIERARQLGKPFVVVFP
jgi:predicted Rossmann fold nucleotide-binding protein DprA/Smf involved in DNA uptake